MAKVPHYTSTTLVDAVRRRGSLPRAASMISDDEILEFANDEIQEHILPTIKSTYEEFFVWVTTKAIEQGKELYRIPERAVGNALRDLAYIDANGNDFEMTRIQRDDRYNTQFPSTYNQPYRYLVQNAHIKLEPAPTTSASGTLEFAFLLRPNMLVKTDQVAKVVSINTTTGEVVVNKIPTTMSSATKLDFLKTKSPHNFLDIDKNASSVNYVTNTFTFAVADLPADLEVGDTIALAYETDIPGIPTEMHRYLLTRTIERVLESLGDATATALAARNTTVSEVNATKLIENRVTSAPLKIKSNNGLLRKKYKSGRKF